MAPRPELVLVEAHVGLRVEEPRPVGADDQGLLVVQVPSPRGAVEHRPNLWRRGVDGEEEGEGRGEVGAVGGGDGEVVVCVVEGFGGGGGGEVGGDGSEGVLGLEALAQDIAHTGAWQTLKYVKGGGGGGGGGGGAGKPS